MRRHYYPKHGIHQGNCLVCGMPPSRESDAVDCVPQVTRPEPKAPEPSPADIYDTAVSDTLGAMHGDTSHDRIVNPHDPDRPCACGWEHPAPVAGTFRPFMPGAHAEALMRMATQPSPLLGLIASESVVRDPVSFPIRPIEGS